MMFAVTIGEVGLQVAALVQAGHWAHSLPSYSHLFLATVVIATSWVGWTLSVAPGARRDVGGIFQWEFLVLLLDVTLVIVYFILARSVDAPASTIAFWILVVFYLYLGWDILTKVILYIKYKKESTDLGKSWEDRWLQNHFVRMLPTVICLVLASAIKRRIESADRPHLLTADVALLSLVLLFRALKDLFSAWVPKAKSAQPQKATPKQIAARKRWSLLWTVVCVLGIVLGVRWTTQTWPLPLPKWVVAEIETGAAGANSGAETPAPTMRREHPKE